jgi:hypothetical protein
MNPLANHCPLPKSAVWRFLSLYFHRNTALPKHRNTSPPPFFSRNPHFPAFRSGHRLFQRPSPRRSTFLAIITPLPSRQPRLLTQ